MKGYGISKKVSLIKLSSTSSAITIMLVFLLVHGVLFGLGLSNENSLLSGDRSTSRNTTISYVFNVHKIGNSDTDLGSSLTADAALHIGDRILSSGHAGDYLIQGAVLALSNPQMLVLLQLVLTFISILCFYALVKHSGFSESTATLSTLFYLILPGSLLPAHQLGSEALCIPSIIVASYFLIISNDSKGMDKAFVAGLLMLSLAIFVRPQLVLFPFLLVLTYFWFSEKKRHIVLVTVLPLTLLFSAIWMVLVVSKDGNFSLGGQDRSIGRSFHDTAEQMAMSGDFEFDQDNYVGRVMPFNEFAKIVSEHSSSYLRQRTVSMVNFTVNSGAYSLAVRHLNYFDKDDDTYYWQHLRARSGIYESVVEILKRGSAFTALIIGSTVAWFLVVLFAVTGLSAFIKDEKVSRFAKVLLLSFAAYQVVIVMLFSVGARWQHRSLLDFIIVLLAIYGIRTFLLFLAAKKVRAVESSPVI